MAVLDALSAVLDLLMVLLLVFWVLAGPAVLWVACEVALEFRRRRLAAKHNAQREGER